VPLPLLVRETVGEPVDEPERLAVPPVPVGLTVPVGETVIVVLRVCETDGDPEAVKLGVCVALAVADAPDAEPLREGDGLPECETLTVALRLPVREMLLDGVPEPLRETVCVALRLTVPVRLSLPVGLTVADAETEGECESDGEAVPLGLSVDEPELEGLPPVGVNDALTVVVTDAVPDRLPPGVAEPLGETVPLREAPPVFEPVGETEPVRLTVPLALTVPVAVVSGEEEGVCEVERVAVVSGEEEGVCEVERVAVGVAVAAAVAALVGDVELEPVAEPPVALGLPDAESVDSEESEGSGAPLSVTEPLGVRETVTVTEALPLLVHEP
jgi:hypothetical protein